MKKIKAIIFSTILFSLVFTACHEKTTFTPKEMVDNALKQVEKVSTSDLKKMLDNGDDYLLLDVRDLNEHKPGFIPGSVCLSRGTLEFNIGKKEFWEGKKLNMPEKDFPIIVYCKKGDRGILAAHTLHHLGYSNVQYLEGGFKAWELDYPKVYDRIEESHDDHAEVGGC
ncbi:MAG: rhodanese-like domain-containing protein [Bacteroidetes bacterium]|jgi:rhodanese-related sulfurtransferase|nr:rhodanese-like domain-containing protein [Bacteroidota bacterium]MBT5531314.1 rhodanese-like domain-containing protein [Cytophagia bacterium]MBT3802863.1 rhodanese-like domain-containing protein [Bacteroidota bacterium]MBT4728913.1 rhodanese-like domain-containing protein [Bacteroidota bacterium]MBT5989923.1 rhodanese-like domain-containing protein [Bacteroidota bacterium]